MCRSPPIRRRTLHSTRVVRHWRSGAPPRAVASSEAPAGSDEKEGYKRDMKRYLALAVVVAAMLAFPGVASAQSGHFVGTPTCTDIGTQISCSGKVAGLGGTTFEIRVSAPGTATVTCTNPAGNVAPGQNTSVTATGSSGPLATPRNGQYVFSLTSLTPTVPNTPTCPNSKWRATVTGVTFGDATLTLLEGGIVSDTIIVPVS